MTSRFALSLPVVLALSIGVGCYTASTPDTMSSSSSSNAPSGVVQSVDGTDPTTGTAEPIADLPCDVAAVLSVSCVRCHGAALEEGAPNHLLSYDDLAAPSPLDPNKTEADLCVQRMKQETKPMPPDQRATDARIATLESWIADGMPKGTCAATPVHPIDYTAPAKCSSKKLWTEKNHGSGEMKPGVACVDCHKFFNKEEEEAEIYSVAGTVYATAHEPDECYGTTNVTVVITGADNKVTKLPVNKAGNFYTTKKIAKPYRAKIVRGSQEIDMKTPQMEGDCNLCHSKDGKNEIEGGEDVGGRIVFPF